MNLIFSDRAWEDYLYWQGSDRQKLRRIHQLLKEISRDPHGGVGKPEPLKHALAGFWSRRIDAEHRLIYRTTAQGLELAPMRYHY